MTNQFSLRCHSGLPFESALMGDLFLLRQRQLVQIPRYFTLAYSVPPVDDRRVVSGIISVIRNGLQWKDVPQVYVPHKALYNRFMR
jgi:putative transposase